MLIIRRKRAWMLDGGVLVEGTIKGKTFTREPDRNHCGLRQSYDADDIGQMIFFHTEGLPYPVCPVVENENNC